MTKKKVVKKRSRKTPIPKVPQKEVRKMAESELDPSVERPPLKSKTGGKDRLRMEAMAIYITDMDGVTVQELSRDPRFKDVHIKTLYRWADEDNWKTKRMQALANVKQRLTVITQRTLTQNLEREVQDLFNLRRQTIHHLGHTPPDKFETVGKLLLDTNKRLSEIAEKMQAGVIDDTGRAIPPEQQAKGGRAMTHDFNPHELREAARSITTKDRGAMRARIAKTKKRKKHEQMGEGHERHDGNEHPQGGVSGAE